LYTGKGPDDTARNFAVVLQYAEQSVPQGEMPQSVEVLIGKISEEEKSAWELGAFLRFEVFATAVSDRHPRVSEIRTQRSLRI
jgi:hypothetical protein